MLLYIEKSQLASENSDLQAIRVIFVVVAIFFILFLFLRLERCLNHRRQEFNDFSYHLAFCILYLLYVSIYLKDDAIEECKNKNKLLNWI